MTVKWRKEKALRTFNSTNAVLSDEEILDLYVVRGALKYISVTVRQILQLTSIRFDLQMESNGFGLLPLLHT